MNPDSLRATVEKLNLKQRDIFIKFMLALKKAYINSTYKSMSIGSLHRTLLDPINLGIGLHRLSTLDQQQILELEKKILEIKNLYALKKS